MKNYQRCRKGPGRLHWQGKGRPSRPLAHPSHAIDCELNDHPSAIKFRHEEFGYTATCNCFAGRLFVVMNADGLPQANSMRKHVLATKDEA